MKHTNSIFLVMLVMMIISPIANADDSKPYIVMQDELEVIKADFNTAANKVRLVFIAGPS